MRLPGDVECNYDYQYSNWANTFKSNPKFYFQPKNVDQLKKVLEYAVSNHKLVSFVGNGRSPSDLPCNNDIMISLIKFDRIHEVDKRNKFVHAEGGVLLSSLIEELKKHDMAIECLPTVDHITLAGAISVGTHGTGRMKSSLSACINEITFLYKYKIVKTVSKEVEPELFSALCVSMGYLGPILSVKLDIVPIFNLEQEIFPETLENVLLYYESDVIFNDHYSLMYYPTIGKCAKFLTNQTTEDIKDPQNTLKNKLSCIILEFLILLCYLFPFLTIKINNFIFDMLYPRDRSRINRGDKIMITDIFLKQYVTEYSFPIEKMPYVLTQLDKVIREKNIYVNAPIEIRIIKADNILLSQNNGEDMAQINPISYCPYGIKCPMNELWECIEELMLEVGGRPHWGKLHRMSYRKLVELYGDNIEAFKTIKKETDPINIYRNQYYMRHFEEVGDGEEDLLKYIYFQP